MQGQRGVVLLFAHSRSPAVVYEGMRRPLSSRPSGGIGAGLLTSRTLCVAPPSPRSPLAAPWQRIGEARDPDDRIAQHPSDGHIPSVGGAPALVFPARAPCRIILWHRSDSPLLARLVQPPAPTPRGAARPARPCVMVAPVPHAEIRLGNGDVYTVEGSLDEVERGLSDAARSGQARLAWFKAHDTGDSIGINPTHVAALRGSETSD